MTGGQRRPHGLQDAAGPRLMLRALLPRLLGLGLGLGIAGSLFLCLLLAHVMADGTTRRCTNDTMMACHVAGDAAQQRTFYAAGAGDAGHRSERHKQG